jgi:ABC-type polysaccharide/polyol phosphate export permease
MRDGRRDAGECLMSMEKLTLAATRVLQLVFGEARSKQVVSRTYAVIYLVYFQLTVQYAKALLGFLWFILTPALFLAIYIPVLTYVFNADPPPWATGRFDYPLFIIAGFLAWNAFAEGLSQGATSLAYNVGVVKHSPLPTWLLPFIKVVAVFFALVVGLLLYLGLAMFLGRSPGFRLVIFPVAFALLFVFTIGLAWLVGSVGVYVRDLLQLLPTVLMIGFFATPVGYDASRASGILGLIVRGNPLTSFLNMFRAALVPTAPFDWSDVAIASAWAGVSFVVGLACFRRLEEGFADAL